MKENPAREPRGETHVSDTVNAGGIGNAGGTRPAEALIVYCHMARYRPGEAVILIGELATDADNGVATKLSPKTGYRVEIRELERTIRVLEGNFDASGFRIELGRFEPGAYSVALAVDGLSAFCAFDVSARASDFVRYGFLAHFNAADVGDHGDLAQMLRYRVNAVMFYDWMYRHHELVPPDESFLDAMGRRVELAAVRAKIAECRRLGMSPVAYGAVYGAESEYIDTRPEQRLYRNDGKAFAFIEKIHLCNIEASNPWSTHIVREFGRAIGELGFEGIHMDQYGYPRTAFDDRGRELNMEDAFVSLIGATRKAVDSLCPDPLVIFNCVNDWPTIPVAGSDSHALYIEVWDPHWSYAHLYRLIREARMAAESVGKPRPIVLAAYIHAFNEKVPTQKAVAAAIVAGAVIAASGATHLIWGEESGGLAEGYYVNHGTYEKSWEPLIASYCNFTVAYRDLLFDPPSIGPAVDVGQDRAGGVNEDIRLENTDLALCPDFSLPGIGIRVRRRKGLCVINLVNLSGSDLVWNRARDFPEAVPNLFLNVLAEGKVESVYAASPDLPEEGFLPRELAWSLVEHPQGWAVRVELGTLRTWSLIWIRYAAD